MVKNLPAKQEMWVQSLGWKNSLEEEMATHSSILVGDPMEGGAWRAIVHEIGHESDTTLQLNNSKKKLKCTKLQLYIKSNISQSENTQTPLYHIILFYYIFSFYHYQKLLSQLFHVWIYLLAIVSTT